MKLLILAAGEGKRLRPLTQNKPKCMVEYQNKPLIDHILTTAKASGIKEIALVGGYKFDILKKHLSQEDITYFYNPRFQSTNMVTTLFQAKEFMDDDLIISYSDIIYTQEVLQKLIDSKHEVSVVSDKQWLKLWSIRMQEPLDDIESFKTKNGNIIELGKKPLTKEDVEGQYIGLIKISKNIVSDIINFYSTLDKNLKYDNNSFDTMYMTTFIQLIIDYITQVKPIYINGSWLEIDTIEDLEQYQRYNYQIS